MHGMKHLRALTMASALVLGGAMAAQAASEMKLPTTVDPVPGNASALEMKSTLQKMGFTEIKPVAHSGDIYTTEAKWHGQWVDLRIDAKTGAIMAEKDAEVVTLPASPSEADVRGELQRLGYTSVQDVQFTGNVITAHGLHYGQVAALSIDTETGVVSREMVNDTRSENAIQLPKANLSATELQQQLAPLGYAQVRNVEEKGNVYTLSAYKNGQWMALRIDAKDGGVTVIE